VRRGDSAAVEPSRVPSSARAQVQAKKKIPETDAIFDQIHLVNARADASEHQLRISVDAKAAVKVGQLSRNGLTRKLVEALDHDFAPDAVVVPVGILVPKTGELWIDIVKSPVTADAIADVVEGWWHATRPRFPGIDWLLVDQDNGPENNSHRTQFMARMVKFADTARLHVELAYYPPYHSKYNPIERCWAALEHYWNGDLLDSLDAVAGFASNMTWKGMHPVVQFVQRVYTKGVTLADAAMREVEARLKRHPTLGRWFVNIDFTPP
jgi:hypothetical protein